MFVSGSRSQIFARSPGMVANAGTSDPAASLNCSSVMPFSPNVTTCACMCVSLPPPRPIAGTALVRRTIRTPLARIMRDLPRIQPKKGRTGTVAGMAGFFGRTHELEVIRAALARAPGEQRPSAVVVDGEPGVGKSRLIDEASRNADRVAVSAYEPEMNLPFSLGHDLIRALARSSQAAGQILGPMLAPEPGGPRPDWTSVFEAAHRAAGVRDSLLLTIDDFQWSDERSRALVHYLVRGAQADGDPLALIVGGRRSIAVSALATSVERLVGDRLTRVTRGRLDHD